MFAAMGIDNKPHGQVHKGRDSLKSYVSMHAERSNSTDLCRQNWVPSMKLSVVNKDTYPSPLLQWSHGLTCAM